MPYIGPDTVALLIRTPTGDYDVNGRPVVETADPVTRGNSVVTVSSSTERREVGRDVGITRVYSMKAQLPADEVTEALTAIDALEFDGRVFELSGEAVLKRTLRGAPDHVRVFGTNEERLAEVGELITITPKGARLSTGGYAPDGVPFDVVADGVNPGNTAARYGVSGDAEDADFTVQLDISVAIRDGDMVTMTGRGGVSGLARVMERLEPWADQSKKIVLVRARTGGGRGA